MEQDMTACLAPGCMRAGCGGDGRFAPSCPILFILSYPVLSYPIHKPRPLVAEMFKAMMSKSMGM